MKIQPQVEDYRAFEAPREEFKGSLDRKRPRAFARSNRKLVAGVDRAFGRSARVELLIPL